MLRLILLQSKLNNLVEHGREANPFFDPKSRKGVHRIGKGVERMVWLNKIKSPQATVDAAKVKAMAKGISKGKDGPLPTLQHRGHGVYVLHDGSHRSAARRLAGKLKVKALVQR